MAEDVKHDKAAAEARKSQQAADGKKAMLDYEAEAAALRARTEKLRAMRLAREAAAPPPPPKKTAAKKTASKKSAKASKEKSRPLSDWLDEQRKDGRRD
jgi:hypothetical protein